MVHAFHTSDFDCQDGALPPSMLQHSMTRPTVQLLDLNLVYDDGDAAPSRLSPLLLAALSAHTQCLDTSSLIILPTNPELAGALQAIVYRC